MASHPPPTSSPSSLTRLSTAILAILFLGLALIYATALLLPHSSSPSPTPTRRPSSSPPCGAASSDLTAGRWLRYPDRGRSSLYDGSCPFHRNSWNCLRNGREDMESINSWAWSPDRCGGRPVPRMDPVAFLSKMRGRRIGFVGDSLNENFLVAFLCALRSADPAAMKWKKKGAWRGGYFPKFDVTVAYHRSVLIAKYTWLPVEDTAPKTDDGIKGIYKVDVDVPADDWINVAKFYDVFLFNTGHWWGQDKFPNTTPLVFYRKGKPIDPPLGILDGLELVLKSMIAYIGKEVAKKALVFWRTQSPRHFYGGEWNQNGSCLIDEPLRDNELDLWFDPRNKGVNREARTINSLIGEAISGANIRLLDVTHLSEYRADAHPAVWLGKKDAVAIWGQDCLHWCLPGLPDTWVDIFAAQVLHNLDVGF